MCHIPEPVIQSCHTGQQIPFLTAVNWPWHGCLLPGITKYQIVYALDSIQGWTHGRTYALILVSTKFLGCIDNQTFLLIELRLKSQCSSIFLDTNIINYFRRNDNVVFARDNLRPYYIDMSVLVENIPLVKFIKTTSGTRVVYFP